MLLIYMMGSLFSEAEVNQRKLEAKYMRSEISKKLQKELNYSKESADIIADDVVFNPIESPFNDKSKLSEKGDIYLGDRSKMEMANHFLVNMDNQSDAGVFMEMGEMIKDKHKGFFPVISDIRQMQAGKADGIYSPWGHNQYVIEALHVYGIEVFQTSQEAIDELVNSWFALFKKLIIEEKKSYTDLIEEANNYNFLKEIKK